MGKVMFDISGGKGSLYLPVDVEDLCNKLRVNCMGGWIPKQTYNTPIGPSEYTMIQECITWLVVNTTRTKKVNRRFGSYYLKHVIERSDFCKSGYICNGTLIVAAAIIGCKLGAWYGPNCCFDIRVNKGVINRGY